MRRVAKMAPVLTFIAILMMAAVSVSAYGYEISISAGKGEFNGGVVRDKTAAINTINVDQADSTITVGDKTYTITSMPDGKSPAESKYFMRGLKLAGDDNSGANTSSSIKLDSMYKDRDVEFVVAYGMKSNMVSYMVHYVNSAGEEIREADNFYGVAGDKVIVSYKYIEGYIPQALTGVATLSADAEKNDFSFVYDEAGTAAGRYITVFDGTTVITGGGANTAGAAGNAGNAGAAGTAAGTGADGGANAGAGAGADGGANIGDGDVPLADQPADTVDLNDNNTPLQEDTGVGNESQSPFANVAMPVKMAILAAGAALVAAIAVAAVRRRRNDDEDEGGELD